MDKRDPFDEDNLNEAKQQLENLENELSYVEKQHNAEEIPVDQLF